jgi:hypothetical protein
VQSLWPWLVPFRCWWANGTVLLPFFTSKCCNVSYLTPHHMHNPAFCVSASLLLSVFTDCC